MQVLSINSAGYSWNQRAASTIDYEVFCPVWAHPGIYEPHDDPSGHPCYDVLSSKRGALYPPTTSRNISMITRYSIVGLNTLYQCPTRLMIPATGMLWRLSFFFFFRLSHSDLQTKIVRSSFFSLHITRAQAKGRSCHFNRMDPPTIKRLLLSGA